MIPGMKTQGTVNLQTAERTHFAKLGMICACCVALLPLCGAGQASKPATSRQQLWDIGTKSLFLSCSEPVTDPQSFSNPVVAVPAPTGVRSSLSSRLSPRFAVTTGMDWAKVALSAPRPRMQRSSLTTSTGYLASPTSNRLTFSSVTL